jgi:hypothetical protein
MTQASAGILPTDSYSLLTTPPCSSLGPNPTIHTPHTTRNLPQSLPSVLTPTYYSFPNANINNRLLSSRSRHHISRAIRNSWASSTVRRYSGAIKQFIQFCDAEGIPDHLRFPADEFVLCAFAASSAGVHARSTPRNRLSALKAWHVVHNMDWKGSARLRYVLNGVHNLAPRGSRPLPRPPVNARMISQLIDHLDLNSPFDVAVAACATTAFWGQCRLGELLPSSASILLSNPFPTRSGFKRSLRNPLSCILHLPRTKTHRQGQDIVLVDQSPPINPIALLKRHLRINNMPNDTHLFSYTSAHTFAPLTKSQFLRRCNDIWHLLGYPRTTGHCFRIGGTTELLIAGVPPDVVKATGRWSSDSFLRYWRSLDDIAPQYIHHLNSRARRRRRH